MQDSSINTTHSRARLPTSLLALVLGPFASLCVYFIPIASLSTSAHILFAVLTW